MPLSGFIQYQSLLLYEIICCVLKEHWLLTHRVLEGCLKLQLYQRCSLRRRCKCPHPHLAPESDAGCCHCGSQIWNINGKNSARIKITNFSLNSKVNAKFKIVKSSGEAVSLKARTLSEAKKQYWAEYDWTCVSAHSKKAIFSLTGIDIICVYTSDMCLLYRTHFSSCWVEEQNCWAHDKSHSTIN